MEPKDYVGKNVSFLPGPKSKVPVTAKVTAFEKKGHLTFLVTKDADGKERRKPPALCKIVA